MYPNANRSLNRLWLTRVSCALIEVFQRVQLRTPHSNLHLVLDTQLQASFPLHTTANLCWLLRVRPFLSNCYCQSYCSYHLPSLAPRRSVGLSCRSQSRLPIAPKAVHSRQHPHHPQYQILAIYHSRHPLVQCLTMRQKTPIYSSGLTRHGDHRVPQARHYFHIRRPSRRHSMLCKSVSQVPVTVICVAEDAYSSETPARALHS